MKSPKLAKRPVTFDYSSNCCIGWDANRFKLTLDANEIHEWKIGDSVPEFSHSVYEVNFYNINGKLLGTILVDLHDYGRQLDQEICDKWYEARHPWLSYKDAVRKGVAGDCPAMRLLVLLDDGFQKIESGALSGLINNTKDFVAFKPLKPYEFAYFNTVNAWKGKV